MNNQNTNTKFKAHVHLMNLIKQRFNVVLEVRHDRFDNLTNPMDKSSGFPRAITHVEAYANIEDAHNRQNVLATAAAYCSWNDQFTRSAGLTVALRRLYQELAAK